MRFALSIKQRLKNLVTCRWKRKAKRPVLILTFSVPANSAVPQSSSGCTMLKVRAEFSPASTSPVRTRMAINIFSREITTEASGCYYWQRGNFCFSCSQPWTHLEMHWIEANAWLFYSFEHKRLGGYCLTDFSLLLLHCKRLSEQDVKSSSLILYLYSSGQH